MGAPRSPATGPAVGSDRGLVHAGQQLIRVLRGEEDAVTFPIGPLLLDLTTALYKLLGNGEKNFFNATIIFG